MRTLTVSTDGYYKALEELSSKFPRRVRKRGATTIKLYFEEFDAEGFYALLDWIAFQENPALKGVPKLAEVTKKNVPDRMTKENINALREYVDENRTMYLEGYVHFRLSDYNDYLNRLMYAVVRKLNK
ncbi:MAG: hypothetical protein LBT59_25780 [Clostridiales bacterium]|jgi:hypothetical protein|nr:hypothetical protein [Clostridiales bacterium]